MRTFAAMQFTDHYRVLGIPPSATIAEIKKAYRVLAQRYHPDKAQGDPEAAALFAAAKEAYETLLDPSKKDAWLQQRWYYQSQGKRHSRDLISATDILKELIELERYTAQLDEFRMDKQGLLEHIQGLLNEDNINLLTIHGDAAIRKEIVLAVCRTGQPLNHAQSAALVHTLAPLCKQEPELETLLAGYLQRKKKKQFREKHTVTLVIVLTILLTLLILFAR